MFCLHNEPFNQKSEKYMFFIFIFFQINSDIFEISPGKTDLIETVNSKQPQKPVFLVSKNPEDSENQPLKQSRRYKTNTFYDFESFELKKLFSNFLRKYYVFFQL